MNVRRTHVSMSLLLAVAFGAPLAHAQERGDRPWDVKRTEATPEAYVQYYLETQEGNPWSFVFTGHCPGDDPWYDGVRRRLQEIPLPALESPKRHVATAVISSVAKCKDSADLAWLMNQFDELTREEKTKAVWYAARHGNWEFLEQIAAEVRAYDVQEQEIILSALAQAGLMVSETRQIEAFFRLWDAGVMPPRFAFNVSRLMVGFEPTSAEFVARVLQATASRLDRPSVCGVLGGTRNVRQTPERYGVTPAQVETLRVRYEEAKDEGLCTGGGRSNVGPLRDTTPLTPELLRRLNEYADTVRPDTVRPDTTTGG